MAQPYKKLNIKKYPRVKEIDNQEIAFWKKFKYPILHNQYYPITCIDFSPVKPHDFVITSSGGAKLFSSTTNEVIRSINRFKDDAYSVRFRSDGRVLVAGGKEGTIRVFDAKSRSVLRTFTDAHSQPIHLTLFAPDITTIMSGSDDKTVCAWDISTEEKLFTLKGHEDYVRCGIISQDSPNIWISGSYDHTIKVWDIRSNECISTLEHDAPVEDIVMFNSGNLFASASFGDVRIFDITGGFRCIEKISNNQKNVTSLAYDHSRGRLLTGSLDQTVKVYDISTMKMVHMMKYPSPILSLGLSPNQTHLVVGMSDGMLSIRHRVVNIDDKEKMKDNFDDSKYPTVTWKYLLRGPSEQPKSSDIKVESVRKQKLAKYDKFLRKFQYKKAFDAALDNKSPDIIVSILEEFIRRHVLTIPLSGRNEVTLKPILLFLLKYIDHPNYMQTLTSVTNVVLDIYAPMIGKSPQIDQLFLKLQKKLKKEIEYQTKLYGLVGVLDLLIANSTSQN